MKETRGLAPGIRQRRGAGQEVIEKVLQYRAQGATPVFRCKAPAGPRVRGFSYNDGDTWAIMEKLWNDVRGWGILMMSTSSIGTESMLMCPPSMLTAKKLPDMTISQQKMSMSDMRLANAWRAKHDYPPVETRGLDSAITHIWKMERSYPGFPAKIAKSDVDSAFKRISARPATRVILATEFPGTRFDSPHDIMMWLTLPFGRSAIQGSFQIAGKFIDQRHNAIASSRPERDGAHTFHIAMYLGDAIMGDVCMGSRLGQVANSWEDSRRAGLGRTSVSETKKTVEGDWEGDQIIFGFLANVDNETIASPKSNIEGSNRLVEAYRFNPCNFILAVQSMRDLRGNFTHWTHRNYLRRTLEDPSVGLLGSEDAGGIWAVCADRERRYAFWHAISWLREQSQQEEWGIYFAVLSVRVRHWSYFYLARK